MIFEYQQIDIYDNENCYIGYINTEGQEILFHPSSQFEGFDLITMCLITDKMETIKEELDQLKRNC